MPSSWRLRFAEAASDFFLSSVTVAFAMTLPSALECGFDPDPRVSGRWSHVQVIQPDTLPELRAVEIDGDAERLETLYPLQLPERALLDVSGEIAEALQVLDVTPVLLRLAGLTVDDGDLPGLGYALGRTLDDRLVDSLLDDLVADVVGAVDVEALLVEAKPDRERSVLDEDQVCRLERHRQAIEELMGADRDPAREHELPHAQVLQADRVESAVLQQAGADVHLVIDPIRLLLLEVVREHLLGGLFLPVQQGRYGLRDARHAVLEEPALAVDGAQARIERAPIRLDAGAHLAAELAEVVEQALDMRAQEGDDPHLVARVEIALDLGDVLVDAVAELVERGQRPRLTGRVDGGGGETELGQHIGLDGEAPLHRRATDIGEPVQGVYALEDDRLHLGVDAESASPVPFEAVEHRLAEAPLDRRVDRRALLLDEGLDARVQLLHAALNSHGEQRQHFLELEKMRRVQVAGVG